jgi:Peptidase family M28
VVIVQQRRFGETYVTAKVKIFLLTINSHTVKVQASVHYTYICTLILSVFMKKVIIWGSLFVASFLSSATAFAQATTAKAAPPAANYQLPDPLPFGQGITPADLKALLLVLAGDSLQGRETGQPGQWLAADFIAAQFKAAGIPAKAERNSYFQPISLEKSSWNFQDVEVNGDVFLSGSDFFVYASQTTSTPAQQLKEVVFVGYGIEEGNYNDYKEADVQGKAVLMYSGEPCTATGKSLLTGGVQRTNWTMDWRKKADLAQKKGAAIVFIVEPRFEEAKKMAKRASGTYGWKPVNFAEKKGINPLNTIFVSEKMAEVIMGKKAGKMKNTVEAIIAGKNTAPIKQKSKILVRLDKNNEILKGSNVLAVIEGTDPKLKEEYVFVTAHYDHLGIHEGKTYYGADDNGSGTSGVIEIARAFAEAKRKGVGPKRTVVCMLVSGEEKGLLGSKFYTEFPIFPLEQTIVDINIDMIGRIDPLHTDGNYLYVIGADRLSSTLHDINERANATYTKLNLDYKYNDPKDPNRYYERSDHYNFAERGIPSIFYFNGTHDDYHEATDTEEKINYEALAKRAQLAFYTAWDIANRPDRLTVNPSKLRKQ